MNHKKRNDKSRSLPTDLRVAIYARVSSDQQAQEATIESQIHDLKARIANDGYELEEEFCFLEDGFTGATLVRPALEQLRDAAYHGGIDRLYVHSPDRLARKYAWQVLLLEEFIQAGVEAVFLNREIGKSPEEDLLLQMQGMIAEYERAKILERSRRGAKGKVRHYAYYRCIGTDAYRFGGQRVCDNKQVRTDLLEEAVWEDVCSLLHDPQRVSAEYERRLNREEPSALAVQQLESQLQKVRRAITRLIDAYEDGLLNKSEFEPRIKSSKERLAKLESESSRLSEAESEESELRLAIGHLEDFAQHVRDGLETILWTDKREIIRALVKRVEVGREEVRVVYKVSLPQYCSARHLLAGITCNFRTFGTKFAS